MADRHPPARQAKSGRAPRAFRSAAGLIFAATFYAAAVTTTGASAEGEFDIRLPDLAEAPVLSYEGNAPVIVGSVGHLFDTGIFSGTNRSEKQARARTSPDVATFAEGFQPLWTQVAAQRAEAETIRVAALQADDDGPRLSVAAIDPGVLGGGGLAAIDALTDPSIPRPATVPETLAYARATNPATDFTPQHEYSEREQWCLATGIYFEARGESYRGQVAVAQVIMNRVADYRYPDTICGVVYQNQSRRNACQFSFACDGIPDTITEPRAWAIAQEITQDVLNGNIYLTEVADSTHYHATYVRPAWAGRMDRVTQIGLHLFYRFKPGWRFG